jgi:hypothetical protein
MPPTPVIDENTWARIVAKAYVDDSPPFPIPLSKTSLRRTRKRPSTWRGELPIFP